MIDSSEDGVAPHGSASAAPQAFRVLPDIVASYQMGDASPRCRDDDGIDARPAGVCLAHDPRPG